MSYTIIYERLFVKVPIDAEDCILPLVLAGSNNCYETGLYGKDRRARDWSTLAVQESEFYNRYGIPVVLIDDADEYVEQFMNGDDMYHFKFNNKFLKDDSFRRFWNNGIKDALTIEEINEKRRYDTYIMVFYGERGNENNKTYKCKTSEELSEALIKVGDYHMEHHSGHMIVSFGHEDVLAKENLKLKYQKKKAEKKNWLKEQGYAYVLKKDNFYIGKLTARRLHNYMDVEDAKQFKDEKSAKKWLEELYTVKGFDKLSILAYHVEKIEE